MSTPRAEGRLEPEGTSTTRFSTVVCGFDGSPEALEAARQALQMAEHGARLVGVSSWDPGLAIHAGIHAGTVAAELRAAGAAALRDAEGELPGLEGVLMRGPDVACLLAAAADADADLLSVGSHGTSRPAGVISGSVATALSHHAPCSVLIARPRGGGTDTPVVIHATDGSHGSLEAGRLAAVVAARSDARLITLHVDGDDETPESIGEEASLPELAGIAHETRIEDGPAAERIIEVAGETGAMLVVVGSRGLSGVRSLGSVSERVAHTAPCSVLIARPKAYPASE